MNVWRAAAFAGFGTLGLAAIACSSSSPPGGTGGSACSELASCCPSAGASQTTCETVVTENVTLACQDEIEALQLEGVCSSAGGSGTGSNSSTTTGTGSCAELATCCGSLSAELQAGCQEVVTVGIAEECAAAMTEECGGSSGTGSGTSTTTGGGGSGCSALASCCSSLETAEQPGCNEVVTEGVDGSCTTLLDSYTEAGLCT